MKICLVCEGCYPYVAGGVSSWVQGLIKNMPQHEFVIWAIGSNESMKGKFVYDILPNTTGVREVFLDSALNTRRRNSRRVRLTPEQTCEIEKLIACEDPRWDVIFDCFAKGGTDPVQFLLDPAFLRILKRVCERRYPHAGFTDYFWNVRSMFLPLLYLINGDFPEADIYHAVSCGYAGILSAAAARRNGKPYMLTEHGIYTREREEEILRSDWVQPGFKGMWIDLFYMFTRCAYSYADTVTSLFRNASQIQREIGCAAEKQLVIPNGVNTGLFGSVPPKKPDGILDIGAIVRLVPIKDIKTMLYAYAKVCAETDKVRLHIIGPVEENPTYYDECLQLKQELGLDGAVFTGRVNTAEYLAKVDITLLTSISEGMPLATLEGMAAGRPAVTTNVGCCEELIHGTDDHFGDAGICVHAMHQKEIADAILTLAANPYLVSRMGEAGRKRVQTYFKSEDMIRNYLAAYDAAVERHGGAGERRSGTWQESDSSLKKSLQETVSQKKPGAIQARL